MRCPRPKGRGLFSSLDRGQREANGEANGTVNVCDVCDTNPKKSPFFADSRTNSFVWGTRDRGFKSRQPDTRKRYTLYSVFFIPSEA